MDSYKILFNILIFMLSICLLGLGGSIALYAEHSQFNLLLHSPNVDCNNASLSTTSECLKTELKTFYKYNFTNVGKIMSFEELKEKGGVCSHYADWYAEQANQKGFFTKEITIDVNESASHVFTVISNSEGYCILDQLNTDCNYF